VGERGSKTFLAQVIPADVCHFVDKLGFVNVEEVLCANLSEILDAYGVFLNHLCLFLQIYAFSGVYLIHHQTKRANPKGLARLGFMALIIR
jgi:hypothetical protein